MEAFGAAFEATIRVRYAETDQMGVAYHANLLPWFEVGRTELLRAVGPPYRQLEAEGILLAVVEARLRYLLPIRYDALLTVRTRLETLGKASVSFSYEVLDAATGTLHASGSTRHACTTPGGAVHPLPPALRDRLAPLLRSAP